MNGFLKKLLTWLVLPAIIVALVYAIVTSILKPVNFNKETARRTEVAVQRLTLSKEPDTNRLSS